MLVFLNIIVLLVDLYDFYLNSCIFDYCFRFWLRCFALGCSRVVWVCYYSFALLCCNCYFVWLCL